ncbi:VOC family protein [uncultured Leifsonia sp.]|uniref:VOC family protein n=1 Tax=uncultured Leifsonia sp. TaxID=340359 RepID=UPI0025F196A8|nr:VOC family protein [uncultured Leifsonia sp.]
MSQGLDRGHYLGTGDSGSGFHVCVEVPDMDQALAFYRDILGLEFAWRSTFRGDFLDVLTATTGAEVDVVQLACPGGSRIELACYTPQGQLDTRRVIDGGLNHLSLGFHDVRAVYEVLTARGVRFASEPLLQSAPGTPVHLWWVTYCYDPWGTPIEIFGPDAGVPDERLF